MSDSQPTLIALLSLLLDKEILTKEEVEDVRRQGKLIPLLIKQGLVTQEEFESRFEDIKKILEVATLIMRGVPVTSAMVNVLMAHRKRFPELVGGILREAKERGVTS